MKTIKIVLGIIILIIIGMAILSKTKFFLKNRCSLHCSYDAKGEVWGYYPYFWIYRGHMADSKEDCIDSCVYNSLFPNQ